MNASDVKFINKYVRITDAGIDLIRVYPFTHLPFIDVIDVKIEDGYLIKNRIPIRIIGSLIIAASLYALFTLSSQYNFFGENGPVSILLLWRLTPLAAVLGIGYMVYESFIPSKIITIKTAAKTYTVTIKDAEKKPQQLSDLSNYLSQRITA